MTFKFSPESRGDITIEIPNQSSIRSSHLSDQEVKTIEFAEEEMLEAAANLILKNKDLIETFNVLTINLCAIVGRYFGYIAKGSRGCELDFEFSREYRDDKDFAICDIKGEYKAEFTFLTKRETQEFLSILFPLLTSYRAGAFSDIQDFDEKVSKYHPAGSLNVYSLISIAESLKKQIVLSRANRPTAPKRDYYNEEYRRLRHEVFLRDGEYCRRCGAKASPGVFLQVDHIKCASKFPQLFLDINNMQVLCEECNIYHKKNRINGIAEWLDSRFYGKLNR